MGDFKMGNNTVLTQSGTAKPTFGSGVPTGTVIQVHCFQNAQHWVNGDGSTSFTQFDQTYTSGGGYVTASDGFRTTISGCTTGSKLRRASETSTNPLLILSSADSVLELLGGRS